MESYATPLRQHPWPDTVTVERRSDVPEIAAYIEDVYEQLRSFSFIINNDFDVGKTRQKLNRHFPESSVNGQKEVLVDDVLRLASLFWEKTRKRTMVLKLEIVDHDMCRLFHQDYYRQRLLCTLKGPGTEWVDHDNVNRNALGKGRNDAIIKDDQKIHRAKAYDVLLLKGKKYGNGRLSDIHRSPPIEHENTTRVLLKIDE